MREPDFLFNQPKKRDDVFCMSPWTHMHALPDRKVIACCLSPMNEPIGDLQTDDLLGIWNSDRMRQLRRDMLNGRSSEDICHRCYEKEDAGMPSLRTGMNDLYREKYKSVVESTKPNGWVDEFNLVHWDFRFSNICNLKCRTCGPGFSSAWNDDYKELYQPGMDKAEFQGWHPKFQRMIRDETRFWEVMTPLFDTVEMIHFAGGEPLIMDEHYRILEELIARKQFDVRIRYSTNFSQLYYKSIDVLKLWEDFNNIDLSLSIDGFGAQFNYIRSGNWNDTKANLERLRDTKAAGGLKGIRAMFHPTISVMNVLHVLDLHRYLLENRHIIPGRDFQPDTHYYTDFVINPVIYPDHYNIQVLPETIKSLVRERYEEHGKWAEDHYGIPKEGLMSVVAHMDAEDKSDQISDFIDLTHRLDNIRNENFKEVFPELNTLIETKWNHG